MPKVFSMTDPMSQFCLPNKEASVRTGWLAKNRQECIFLPHLSMTLTVSAETPRADGMWIIARKIIACLVSFV